MVNNKIFTCPVIHPLQLKFSIKILLEISSLVIVCFEGEGGAYCLENSPSIPGATWLSKPITLHLAVPNRARCPGFWRGPVEGATRHSSRLFTPQPVEPVKCTPVCRRAPARGTFPERSDRSNRSVNRGEAQQPRTTPLLPPAHLPRITL